MCSLYLVFFHSIIHSIIVEVIWLDKTQASSLWSLTLFSMEFFPPCFHCSCLPFVLVSFNTMDEDERPKISYWEFFNSYRILNIAWCPDPKSFPCLTFHDAHLMLSYFVLQSSTKAFTSRFCEVVDVSSKAEHLMMRFDVSRKKAALLSVTALCG